MKPMNAYDDLFNRYLVDLRGAREEALAWWDKLLERERSLVADDVTARLRVDLRWPCGPASFPRVVAVFRQYYLECEALSVTDPDVEGDPSDESSWGTEENDEDEGVWLEPRQLLIDNLINIDETLSQFMKFFAFIPVGRDELGRSV